MRLNDHGPLFILLILGPFLLFALPVHGQTSDSNQTPVLVWSDRLGNSNILVAGSDDGNTIAAGSGNRIIRMYDQAGDILWTWNETRKTATSVAVSGNGEIAAAGFIDPHQPNDMGGGEIICFNRSGSILWRYSTNASVHRIAVSWNGSRIFASGNTKLYFFDRNGTRTGMFDTGSAVWSVATDRDGTIGIAGMAGPLGGVYGIYGIHPDGAKVLDYSTISGSRGIHDVAISRTGSTIAGVDDNQVTVIDPHGRILWRYNWSASYARVAVSSNGEYTATGSQYYVRYFNRTGSLQWEAYIPAYVNDIAITGHGDRVFAGTSAGTFLFDGSGHYLWKSNITAFSVSAAEDGSYFIAGDATTVYFFGRNGTPSPAGTAGISGAERKSPDNSSGPVSSRTGTTPSSPLSLLVPVVAIAGAGIAAGVTAYRSRKYCNEELAK